MNEILPAASSTAAARTPVSCPLCHTINNSIAADSDDSVTWRCARCSQTWNAERVRVATAYALAVA